MQLAKTMGVNDAAGGFAKSQLQALHKINYAMQGQDLARPGCCFSKERWVSRGSAAHPKKIQRPFPLQPSQNLPFISYTYSPEQHVTSRAAGKELNSISTSHTFWSGIFQEFNRKFLNIILLLYFKLPMAFQISRCCQLHKYI